MLKKVKQRKESGFTIIEVLIVLAIAGLILLVVLLAVPALQRNGRNTTVKNDASAIAGGISDFESNNSGATPTGGTLTNGTLALKTASISNGATAKVQGSTKVNGVGSGTVTFATTTVPTTTSASAGALYVDSGESCQQTNGTAPTKSSRAFAVYFWTESPGITAGVDAVTGINNGAGLKGQCLDT